MMKLKLLVLIVILTLGVSPVLAQDEGGTHTVAFDGVSFTYDTSLAANVNIVPFGGDPVDLEAPGGPQAPYTEYVLYNGQPAPEGSWDAVGSVRVYRTADFAGYSEHEERFGELQSMLDRLPCLAGRMVGPGNLNEVTLPLLPVLPAGQIVRARAEYVDTGSLSGIRFLTAYGQDMSPMLHDSIFYTFQGISADGAYYVSIIVWLDSSMLPAEVGADFDWDAFYAEPAPYFTDLIATLNAAAPDAFTPSLATLDAMVQSVSFGE